MTNGLKYTSNTVFGHVDVINVFREQPGDAQNEFKYKTTTCSERKHSSNTIFSRNPSLFVPIFFIQQASEQPN